MKITMLRKTSPEPIWGPQLQVSAHMTKLLSLNTITSMKHVHDGLVTQVRSLSSLGLDTRNYGPMLMPVLMAKLPDELKLIISRQFGKDIWEIELILKVFRHVLGAREKVTANKEFYSVDSEKPYSGSALFSGAGSKRFNSILETTFSDKNNLQCFFCKRNHLSKNCSIITKPEVRKDILYNDKRCKLVPSASCLRVCEGRRSAGDEFASIFCKSLQEFCLYESGTRCRTMSERYEML